MMHLMKESRKYHFKQKNTYQYLDKQINKILQLNNISDTTD